MSSALRSSRVCVIQVKLSLERPVGDPSTALQQLDDLVDHRKEVHHRPSTCASAASASGSQRVIAIDWYNAMAAANPVRASSRWPVAAYRVPRPRWQWA